MLFKISNLNPNLALTLGYLNLVLKNSTLTFFFSGGPFTVLAIGY